MPYPRPTLVQLRDQIVADMQSGDIPGILNVMFKSVLWVFANVWAGMSHLHYGFLAWIAKQAVPWTATGIFLEAWASLKNIFRKAASPATGQVTFKGSEALPAKTLIILTGGVKVMTNDEALSENGQIVANAQTVNKGSDQNIVVGSTAILSSPIAGINMNGVVTAPFTGGSDLEDDDSLRSRMLQAYKEGGENGSASDYVKWSLSVSGVTRAWCYRSNFMNGTMVMVLFMCDKVNAENGGYPVGTDGSASEETRYTTASGDQLRIAEAIYPLRPVTALVCCSAPIKQPVDFVIENLGTNNTAENQQNIKTVLKDMFQQNSSPGATISPSVWQSALLSLNLPGVFVSSPTAPIIAEGSAYMPDLGNVTFVS